MTRVIARLVESSGGARLVPTFASRAQLLRSGRLLRRLTTSLPPNSPQYVAAKAAAAWLSQFVELSLAGSVSQETPDRKTLALPTGDRT